MFSTIYKLMAYLDTDAEPCKWTLDCPTLLTGCTRFFWLLYKLFGKEWLTNNKERLINIMERSAQLLKRTWNTDTWSNLFPYLTIICLSFGIGEFCPTCHALHPDSYDTTCLFPGKEEAIVCVPVMSD